jgi:hypothetical protein
MKIKLLLVLAVILLSLNIYSQRIIIRGEETNRKLTWDDFTGKPDKSVSFLAYTRFKLSYEVGDVKVIGDSVAIDKFLVTVELDPKESWAKKDKVSDALLVHEQGHFDIGILCMKEILANYKQVKYTKSNFNYVIQGVINKAGKKYSDMTLQYDRETKHSSDKEQQAKWNAFFLEELSK